MHNNSNGNLWASETHWRMSLCSPPVLHALGFGTHGGDVPRQRYKLRGMWCVHLYRYKGEAHINGQKFTVQPGFASVTPPDTDLEHVWIRPDSVHITAHFMLDSVPGQGIFIPAMQDLGVQWQNKYEHMAEAVGHFSTQPRRADAALWTMLWHLADAFQHTNQESITHPVVEWALHTIEARLAMPLSVAELAQEYGFSSNHFTRLFQAGTGETVVGYIGRRRMERARHLLSHSSLPVKAVAVQSGMPDLHQFNKAVRRAVGLSPRKIRSQQ